MCLQEFTEELKTCPARSVTRCWCYRAWNGKGFGFDWGITAALRFAAEVYAYPLLSYHCKLIPEMGNATWTICNRSQKVPATSNPQRFVSILLSSSLWQLLNKTQRFWEGMMNRNLSASARRLRLGLWMHPQYWRTESAMESIPGLAGCRWREVSVFVDDCFWQDIFFCPLE